MHAKFGVAKSVGEAATYQSKEAVDAVVREHILVRNGLREKKSKAAPGAAAPEPTPAAPARPRRGREEGSLDTGWRRRASASTRRRAMP